MRLARRLLTVLPAAGFAGGVGLLWAVARSRPPATGPEADPPPGLPPGRVVAVSGHGELFVREAPGPGDRHAPTIVLLHGWMYPSDTNWFTSYAALAAVGRVLAVDCRGHGRGSRPAGPFRLVDAADDVAALLRQLGTGPVVAVGYSMGGPIAQLLWRRHPDLVRGLVLCATSANWDVTPLLRWAWRGMGLLQVALRLMPRHWLERLMVAQAGGRLPVRLTRMINEDTPKEVLERLPWLIGELSRGSAEDLAEAGRELGRYDARDWVGGIDVPVAVLVTTEDELVPADSQRELARRTAARVYELALRHDAVVAGSDRFVPALVDAVRAVSAGERGRPPAAGLTRPASRVN